MTKADEDRVRSALEEERLDALDVGIDVDRLRDRRSDAGEHRRPIADPQNVTAEFGTDVRLKSFQTARQLRVADQSDSRRRSSSRTASTSSPRVTFDFLNVRLTLNGSALSLK